MNSRLRTIEATLGIILIFAMRLAQAEIIAGTGILTYGEWDFSTSTAVNCYCGDIYVAEVFEPPLGVMVHAPYPPGMIICLPDSSFDDLSYAPQDTLAYAPEQHAYVNVTYVVRTLEGHYAKFRFTTLQPFAVVIDYVYQSDGTRRLHDEIGVESHTWSSIKCLFR